MIRTMQAYQSFIYLCAAGSATNPSASLSILASAHGAFSVVNAINGNYQFALSIFRTLKLVPTKIGWGSMGKKIVQYSSALSAFSVCIHLAYHGYDYYKNGKLEKFYTMLNEKGEKPVERIRNYAKSFLQMSLVALSLQGFNGLTGQLQRALFGNRFQSTLLGMRLIVSSILFARFTTPHIHNNQKSKSDTSTQLEYALMLSRLPLALGTSLLIGKTGSFFAGLAVLQTHHIVNTLGYTLAEYLRTKE